MPCQGYRGYISSNMDERSVPQNVQQLVIRDYCKRNGLEFLLSATEYCNGYIMLNSLFNDMAIKGIVMYSIFQMPDDYNARHRLWLTQKPSEIHFSAENIRITNLDEAFKLEDVFLIKKIISCQNTH